MTHKKTTDQDKAEAVKTDAGADTGAHASKDSKPSKASKSMKSPAKASATSVSSAASKISGSSASSRPHASKVPPVKPKTKAHAASTKPSAGAKKRGGNGFLWLIIVVIIVGGSGMVTWPYIGPYVSEKAQPLVDDMRARLGLSPRTTDFVDPALSVEPVETAVVEAPQEQPPKIEAPAVPVASEFSPVSPLDAPLEIESAPALMPERSPAPELAPAGLAPELLSRLDQLEGQLGSMESMGSGSNADAQAALSATQELSTLISALNARLDAMDKALQDLQAQKSNQITGSVSAQALVLATTQLRMRLRDDSAFMPELEMLERLAGNDAQLLAAVSRLKPHAEVGVPSTVDLTARFAAVSRDIVRASNLTGEAGWLGAVKDSLSGLVTVRRTDPNEITNDIDRALAVADKALQAGNLEKAIGALSTLQGSPGDAAAAWLGDARARFDAETALDALYNQALAAMANVGGA